VLEQPELSNRTLYRKTLMLHRAVVDAIETGKDDASEAAMLAVLAQTSRDIATQTKVAMKGKRKVTQALSELE